MKSISIAGGIGKDAVTRTTQNGDKVTSWSVAVEERNGQDKRTLWFDCALWGKRGEVLAQYLTKGSKVAVSGEMSTREHEGKTYLTVRVNEVALQGGGQERRENGHGEQQANSYSITGLSSTGGAGAGARPSYEDMGDEIPFAPEWRI